jgi:hypothetical protein
MPEKPSAKCSGLREQAGLILREEKTHDRCGLSSQPDQYGSETADAVEDLTPDMPAQESRCRTAPKA